MICRCELGRRVPWPSICRTNKALLSLLLSCVGSGARSMDWRPWWSRSRCIVGWSTYSRNSYRNPLRASHERSTLETRNHVHRRNDHLQHAEDRKDTMIEWVSYSNHNIKVCSLSLTDVRWLPLALIWKSAGTQELFKIVQGEPTEVCKSCKEADSLALRKAKH